MIMNPVEVSNVDPTKIYLMGPNLWVIVPGGGREYVKLQQNLRPIPLTTFGPVKSNVSVTYNYTLNIVLLYIKLGFNLIRVP